MLTAGWWSCVALLGSRSSTSSIANLPIVRFVFAVDRVLLMTHPDGVPDHLHGDEDHRPDEPPDRAGPGGPWGSLLSVVHGLKVLMKEDFTPTGADRARVHLGAGGRLPRRGDDARWSSRSRRACTAQDMNIGLLYFFAVGGLSRRRAADGRLVELQQVLAARRPALGGPDRQLRDPAHAVGRRADPAGRHDEPEPIVEQQAGWFTDWYVFQQPLGALIFFIAATAEANRTPFDLTEADSEIVAGFATEYSGMRFGFFFFAEYVNVFIVSALTVTLFFGGWNAPFPWPWPIDPDRSTPAPRHRAAVPRRGRAAGR